MIDDCESTGVWVSALLISVAVPYGESVFGTLPVAVADGENVFGSLPVAVLDGVCVFGICFLIEL